MARTETRLAKTLYFCNVKNNVRHVVAAECSVFRANNLEVKLYPDECGNSNAHKGFAHGTLTARIGILLCHNTMAKNEKQLQGAQLKTVESIQEYFNDFHSVAEMYERSAKALAALMHVSPKLAPEAKSYINDMVQDHICLLDMLKPLEEKGE